VLSLFSDSDELLCSLRASFFLILVGVLAKEQRVDALWNWLARSELTIHAIGRRRSNFARWKDRYV
jgi:hypothetical protein